MNGRAFTAFGLLAACLVLSACAARPRLHHSEHFRHADSRDEAAHSFDLGVTAYERGEPARALGYFMRAYSLAPSAVVLFNLARVHDSMGRSAPAARFYVAYLQVAGTPTQPLVGEASRALDRLAPEVCWIIVSASAVDRVQVDGEDVPAARFGYPFAVEYGPHTLSALGHAEFVLRLRHAEIVETSIGSQPARVAIGSATAERLRQALAPRGAP